VPGLAFRRGAAIERTQSGPVIVDLDAVPPPSFHLLPDVQRYPFYPVEAGRGCPFSCTFCSTNDFFRRKFRLRSPAAILREMDRLHALYSVRAFDLVHDMFTVDRRKVVEFCQTMLDAGRGYRWTCSARTDCVDEPLLRLMWEAGCRGLFFGVESGSPRMQKSMDKCLDIDEALRAIHTATGQGIETTVALITGFPDEERSDLEATLQFAFNAARSPKARVQFALLAPLAGTPILARYRDQLVFDGNFSSMSVEELDPDPDDTALIREFPALFPNFYGIPTALDRSLYSAANSIAGYLLRNKRGLALAIEQESESLLDFVESCWRTFRAAPDSPSCVMESAILEFVEAHLHGPKVGCILAYERAVAQLEANPPALAQTGPSPRLSSRCGLFRFDFNLESVVSALESSAALSKEARQPAWTLVERTCTGTRYTMMPTAGVLLLELCDGTRTLGEVAGAFAATYPQIEGAPGAELAKLSLAQLRERAVLLYEPTAINEAAACSAS
jgi:hypothetical protein